MDISKDYYAVLGVLPSIDPDALKAVYHALMKKFHPDVYMGNKDEAERIASELSNAFTILRDSKKRACYDTKRTESARYARGQFESQHDTSQASDSLENGQEEAWGYIIQYSPEVLSYFRSLSILSPHLALQYQITLIELKLSHDAERVREVLEAEFLLRFFGDSTVIHDFVRKILIKGRRDVAGELNKAIRIMGSPKNDTQAKSFINTARKKIDNVDEIMLRQTLGERRYAEIVSTAMTWDVSLSITQKALDMGVESHIFDGRRIFVMRKYTSEVYFGASVNRVFNRPGGSTLRNTDLYDLVESIEIALADV